MSQINVDIITSQSAGPVTIQDNLIVTGTTNIKPYKVYVARLSQSGSTANPDTDILENTLGATITWTRQSTGIYLGTSSVAMFDAHNTMLLMNNVGSAGFTYPTYRSGGYQAANEIAIICRRTDSVGTYVDPLGPVFVEIRVYPV